MYITLDLGLKKNIEKSRLKSMIWIFKKMRSINTSLRMRMGRLKTTEETKNLMMSFMSMRKWGIFVTLTEALWIWAISAMEKESSCKN